jgi:hypothetical protein
LPFEIGVVGGGPHSGGAKKGPIGPSVLKKHSESKHKKEKTMANTRIIDLVRAKRDANVAAGKGNDHEPAKRTGDLAVAAIIGGVQSPAWEIYMQHFGEATPLTPGQLERMCARDDTKDIENFNEKRAYLVANGTCGMTSPDTLNLDVEVNSIDDGLAACDPNHDPEG